MKLIKPIPTMLAAIAADSVNNFRQSLDQAAYAVSAARYGSGVRTLTSRSGILPLKLKTAKQEVPKIFRTKFLQLWNRSSHISEGMTLSGH
jgi:hypothetical protein